MATPLFMTRALVVLACVGCSSPAPTTVSTPTPPPPSGPLAKLVSSVAHPRVVATLALTDPALQGYFAGVDQVPASLGGKTFEECDADFSAMRTIRIVVGEPLVIAAEIDGPIDREKTMCILGEGLAKLLDENGIEILDRPNGIALRSKASAAQAPEDDGLVAMCGDGSGGIRSTCFAFVLGPRKDALRVHGHLDGKGLVWTIGGQAFSRTGADAFVAAIGRAANVQPALRAITTTVTANELVVRLPDVRDGLVSAALKEYVIESFRIPSVSMVPTLHIGDNVFVLKGVPITPGDVVVTRENGRNYIKRVIAVGGQKVTETPTNLEIDGRPLPSTLVAPAYRFRDVDANNQPFEKSGALHREQLGARSYKVVHTGEHRTGTWSVPDGHYFLVGDNRENSNDSRFMPPVAADDIVGRVIGIWLATDDGVPSWDRIGRGID